MKTIDIVYKMVTNEHAFAVIGNHEFNAIAYSLFDKNKADFLRPRLGKQEHTKIIINIRVFKRSGARHFIA